MTETTVPEDKGGALLRLASTDQLGPAYLGDGRQAFPAATVATWPDHNSKAMTVQLFTAEQVSAKVAAERERWQRIAAAAQDVTNGAEDIGDFLVSSSLMAALALALDEGPNV